MKLFGKFDVFLYLIIFSFLFCLFFFREAPGDVRVYVDGDLYMIVSLTENAVYEIEDFMKIEISDSRVRVTESTCPDKLCIKAGWVDTPGIPIVCVPNKTMVIIEGKDRDIDVITQ